MAADGPGPLCPQILSINHCKPEDKVEELLVYAILLYQNLTPENEYKNLLDKLFLENPENDDLLYLEWEPDIKESILYIRKHLDYSNLNYEQFGAILMDKLKIVYENNPDIKSFAIQISGLWENLPENIQNTEPFHILTYADDPLSWGDEEQSRNIYEHMLKYYKQ